MIVASMACISHRRGNLLRISESIRAQCDVLIVHADFAPTKDELNIDDKTRLHVHKSQTSEVRMNDAADYPDAYYLMIDDDISYPVDYAMTMVSALNTVGRKAVVCVHGSILDFSARDQWYAKRTVLHFRNELQEPTIVHIPGAGTSCFHTSELVPAEYVMENMTDVQLAVMSKRIGLHSICISREANWMNPIRTTGTCIYNGANFHEKRNEYIRNNLKTLNNNESK